jgi:Domain of unknown function (DUF6378)
MTQKQKVKLSPCMRAEKLTNGDRRDTYGHPMDNFGRTAKMVTAFLQHKLKPGEVITEEEWGLINVIAKVSRCANKIKLDTIDDIAGYANTIGMVMDKREENKK